MGNLTQKEPEVEFCPHSNEEPSVCHGCTETEYSYDFDKGGCVKDIKS